VVARNGLALDWPQYSKGKYDKAQRDADHAGRGISHRLFTVEVITFDNYARERKFDLDRVGLIKVDVEGFEAGVFDGMQGMLAKSARKGPILCEVLTDLDRAEPLDGGRIIERLEDCGYRCLDATQLRPINRDALGFDEDILCL
jgi:hypothetical protein